MIWQVQVWCIMMFIVWGVASGIELVIHVLSKQWIDKIPDNKYTKVSSWFIRLAMFPFAWIYSSADGRDDCYNINRQHPAYYQPRCLYTFLI